MTAVSAGSRRQRELLAAVHGEMPGAGVVIDAASVAADPSPIVVEAVVDGVSTAGQISIPVTTDMSQSVLNIAETETPDMFAVLGL